MLFHLPIYNAMVLEFSTIGGSNSRFKITNQFVFL